MQISRFEHWIWIAIEQEIIYQTFGKKSSLLKSLVTNCLKTQWTVNNLVRILNPISFKAWIHHIKVQKLQCTSVNFVAFKVWYFADWFFQPKSSRFIFHAVLCQRIFQRNDVKSNMRSCNWNGIPKPPILLSIFFTPKRSVQVFKFLKSVYQGFRFVGCWWLRCWACWFTSLLLLPILIVYIYLLYHRSSCGHPFGILDFYGFLGLAARQVSACRRDQYPSTRE